MKITLTDLLTRIETAARRADAGVWRGSVTPGSGPRNENLKAARYGGAVVSDSASGLPVSNDADEAAKNDRDEIRLYGGILVGESMTQHAIDHVVATQPRVTMVLVDALRGALAVCESLIADVATNAPGYDLTLARARLDALKECAVPAVSQFAGGVFQAPAPAIPATADLVAKYKAVLSDAFGGSLDFSPGTFADNLLADFERTASEAVVELSMAASDRAARASIPPATDADLAEPPLPAGAAAELDPLHLARLENAYELRERAIAAGNTTLAAVHQSLLQIGLNATVRPLLAAARAGMYAADPRPPALMHRPEIEAALEHARQVTDCRPGGAIGCARVIDGSPCTNPAIGSERLCDACAHTSSFELGVALLAAGADLKQARRDEDEVAARCVRDHAEYKARRNAQFAAYDELHAEHERLLAVVAEARPVLELVRAKLIPAWFANSRIDATMAAAEVVINAARPLHPGEPLYVGGDGRRPPLRGEPTLAPAGRRQLADLLRLAARVGSTSTAFEEMFAVDLAFLGYANEAQRDVDPDAHRGPPSNGERYAAALREAARRVLAGDLPLSMRAGAPADEIAMTIESTPGVARKDWPGPVRVLADAPARPVVEVSAEEVRELMQPSPEYLAALAVFEPPAVMPTDPDPALVRQVFEVVRDRLVPAWRAGGESATRNIIDIAADIVHMVDPMLAPFDRDGNRRP